MSGIEPVTVASKVTVLPENTVRPVGCPGTCGATAVSEMNSTLSRKPASEPALPAASFTYCQRKVCAPAGMTNVCCRQSTSPERRASSVAPRRKRNRSLFVCEETFHANLIVPGPVTFASSKVFSLFASTPLRAALQTVRVPAPCRLLAVPAALLTMTE